MGPFAKYAERLLVNGYSPVPLHPASGLPAIKGWDRLREAPLLPAEIGQRARHWPNLGLAVAGGFNGLVPIDVDVNGDVVLAVMDTLPETPVMRHGSKGLVLFFRDQTGAVSARKFMLKSGKPLVEVLSTGLVAIPPTLHRKTGRPYEWLGLGLDYYAIDELPVITPEHIAALEEVLAPWCPRRPVYVPNDVGQDAPPASNRRMLAFAKAVLRNEVQRLEKLTGGRNNGLFDAMCKLGRYVHRGVLTLAEVETALIGASRKNGYIAKQGLKAARQTIASGLHTSRTDKLPALKDRRPGPS
jgi:hypothetical protein